MRERPPLATIFRTSFYSDPIYSLDLDQEYGARSIRAKQLSAKVITDIRDALNTGPVLGNDRIIAEVEELTGQRQ